MKYVLKYTDEAMRDIEQALVWTKEQFGGLQRSKYQKLINSAARLLEKSPTKSPTRARDDIAQGIRCLHIAKRGKNARHCFYYRIKKNGEVYIARFLHDAMDVSQLEI